MTEHEALQKIADLKPEDAGHDYVDEWVEADLFGLAQSIAREALEHNEVPPCASSR